MANTGNKVSTLEGLQASMLRAKGYTAEQIAALLESLQEIFGDINASLEAADAHISSAHAPADAEPNAIVGIKRNGAFVAAVDKIIDILVPTKTSDLTNDSGFQTGSQVEAAVNGAGHLKSLVVETLPAPADADRHTIYYLRRNDGEPGDQYTEYQLINGAFEIVGAARANLAPYLQKSEAAKASNSLIQSIVTSKTASSDTYIGAANLALFWSLIQPYLGGSDLVDLTARVRLLELVVFNDEIEGNPYLVTFDNLSGLNASGVWNVQNSRIEF